MKYKLFIRQYDITTNDYKVKEEEVETNDIYHTIGKIYCTSITEIKRIDYMKIDKEKELQQKIDKALEYTKITLKFAKLEKDFEKEKILLNFLEILGDKENE